MASSYPSPRLQGFGLPKIIVTAREEKSDRYLPIYISSLLPFYLPVLSRQPKHLFPQSYRFPIFFNHHPAEQWFSPTCDRLIS